MTALQSNVLDVALDDIILHLTDLQKGAAPDEREEFAERLEAARSMKGMTLVALPTSEIDLSHEQHHDLYDAFSDTCADVLEEMLDAGWSKAAVYQHLKDSLRAMYPPERPVRVDGELLAE